MANKVQILDKISRNLQQMGIATTRGAAAEVQVAGMTISYEDADISKPEGGIDGTVSPFLGIGVANPGKIKIDLGGAGLDSLVKVKVLRACSGHANDIKLANSGAAAIDGDLPGTADMLGMGM